MQQYSFSFFPPQYPNQYAYAHHSQNITQLRLTLNQAPFQIQQQSMFQQQIYHPHLTYFFTQSQDKIQQQQQIRSSQKNDQKYQNQQQQQQYQDQIKANQSPPKQSSQKLIQSQHDKSTIPNQTKPQSPQSQTQLKVQQQKNQQQSVQQLQINKPLQNIQQPYQSKKDDELKKLFQVANDRPKDLVQKHQNPEVKQQQQKQQQLKPQLQPKQEQQTKQQQVQNNQLQELALQYDDGFIYRGQGYEPATREGQGILTDQNDNTVYNGQWKANKYHGQGKLTNIQAEEIEGPFDYQDLRVIQNGWLGYEGNFSEGKMKGFGKLQLTNGEVFEGQFQDGIIDGKGTFTTVNGQILKGLWKEGILTQVIY
ncbi:unnamed protein product [Paramecium pentaurelia]|uniref:MORN repeat protein n=1 Tax=Paramecium pentaurelia TaxID=43138 RepID=A0A8S1SLU4_9CILI|nr:unnamed protein product [Paramecium pentaurelia]